MNARSGGVDLLAQTTMHVEEVATEVSVRNLIVALQSVPGVLLARPSVEAGTEIVVSHDAGVSRTALLAAARGARVRVKIARAYPAVTDRPHAGPEGASVWLHRVRGAWMLLVLTLAIVAIATPGGARWAVPAYGVAIGVYLAFAAFAARRPS